MYQVFFFLCYKVFNKVYMLPLSLPSKCGLVATLRPGCGIKKQPILLKQERMCFLICCNSGCCLSEICNKTKIEITFLLTVLFGFTFGQLPRFCISTNRNFFKLKIPNFSKTAMKKESSTHRVMSCEDPNIIFMNDYLIQYMTGNSYSRFAICMIKIFQTDKGKSKYSQ